MPAWGRLLRYSTRSSFLPFHLEELLVSLPIRFQTRSLPPPLHSVPKPSRTTLPRNPVTLFISVSQTPPLRFYPIIPFPPPAPFSSDPNAFPRPPCPTRNSHSRLPTNVPPSHLPAPLQPARAPHPIPPSHFPLRFTPGGRATQVSLPPPHHPIRRRAVPPPPQACATRRGSLRGAGGLPFQYLSGSSGIGFQA